MAWDDIPTWAPDVANSLLQTVQLKDQHTYLHCARVGRAARRLAQAMGLNEFEQAIMEFSGLFHDVGKVGIPDDVLLKPGKLTPEQIDVMKNHPIQSIQIIEPFSGNPFFRFLLPGVRYHHEKIDGTGYPFGLKGERIPLPARVVAVVDTVDAMTNARPYRKALPMEKAIQELKDFSGTQFDEAIVKTYIEASKYWKGIDHPTEGEIVIGRILKVAA